MLLYVVLALEVGNIRRVVDRPYTTTVHRRVDKMLDAVLEGGVDEGFSLLFLDYWASFIEGRKLLDSVKISIVRCS